MRRLLALALLALLLAGCDKPAESGIYEGCSLNTWTGRWVCE